MTKWWVLFLVTTTEVFPITYYLTFIKSWLIFNVSRVNPSLDIHLYAKQPLKEESTLVCWAASEGWKYTWMLSNHWRKKGNLISMPVKHALLAQGSSHTWIQPCFFLWKINAKIYLCIATLPYGILGEILNLRNN